MMPLTPLRAIPDKQAAGGKTMQAVVAGAGIAGLATALALHQRGIPVRVLEAGPNLRAEGTAIGLWDNAWRALDVLGVADAVRPLYRPLNM